MSTVPAAAPVTTGLDAVLLAVLSDAALALDDAGVPADRIVVTAGATTPWDNCCENGGQVYIRLDRLNETAAPGAPFPARPARNTDCPALYAAQAALGVVRCAHTVDDDGAAPSAAEESADALATIHDAGILRGVILGAPEAHRQIMKAALGDWTPVGAQGGCVGGEWQMWLGVPPDCLRPATAAPGA